MHGQVKKYSPEVAERLLKRLEGCEGNLRLAAKSLGLSKGVVYHWWELEPEFRQKCQEIMREKKAA